MFCPSCGSQVTPGSTFCPACGHRLAAPSPQNAAPSPGARRSNTNVVDSVVDRLNEMAGGTDHVELTFSNFIDAVPKRHERDEMDRLFACGTPETTPPLSRVSSAWPHPWVYSRVFAVLLVTFLGLWLLSSFFQNPIGYPGFMFVGALMVPFAVVVFFFETNAFRNLGLIRVLEIFFVGGVLSILCIYPLSLIFPGGGAGDLGPAMITGIVEELAKAAVVALFFKLTGGRHYVLTGLLIGAAVGAGFAVFETAGYIFGELLEPVDLVTGFANMAELAGLRAWLAPGGHVAWAAVEGGALALCDKGQGFELGHLASKTFFPFLLIPIVLHGLWDTLPLVPFDLVSVPLLGTLKYALLIAAIWVVLLVLLHRGLAQVNELSRAAGAPTSENLG